MAIVTGLMVRRAVETAARIRSANPLGAGGVKVPHHPQGVASSPWIPKQSHPFTVIVLPFIAC
jgi:hypothetical protein